MSSAGSHAGPSTRSQAPPLVRGLPLIGSALDLLRAPVGFFVQAYQEYGPVFRVRIPTAPHGELTVMAGPEAHLFAAHEGARYFTTREYYRHLTRETGTENYLSALDGPLHHHYRKVLAPGFSREALVPYLQRMVEITEQAARSWEPGQRIAVLETLQRLTVDQLALAAANCPIDALRYHDLETYARTFVGAGVALRPGLLFRLPAYRAAKRRFEAYLTTLVEAHRQSTGAGRSPDLVDVVLAATDPGGQPLSAADRLASTHLPYVNGLIYAGRVCAYVLYALLKDPRLMERVTDELDAVWGQEVLTLQTLRRMRLLRGTILESYRCYPVAACVPRHVAQPFEFAGYRIAAGSTVFVAVCVNGFLPELFADPQQFDPDRYSPPRNEHHQRGAFAPYGLGSHACISTGLVETVITVTLATLLRTSRLTLDPPSYTIRTRVDPVPGPERRFAVRVVAQREARPPAGLPQVPEELDLSGVLREVDKEWLKQVTAAAGRRRYPPGAIIIRQGDPADAFFILTAGDVEVLAAQAGEEPRLIDRLHAGDYFGEIGLLHGGRRTATVRAGDDRPVELLVLGREAFLNLVATSDLVSDEIALVVRRRDMQLRLAATLPRLDSEQLKRIARGAQLQQFAPGAVIIRQGDPAEVFYVLSSGRAEVVSEHGAGRETVIDRLEPGQFFGEIGILQNRPRTATVRAAVDSPVEVLAIDRGDFLGFIDTSQATSSAVAAAMVERLIRLGESARPQL